VWLAQSGKHPDGLRTLVMDLEGTDGRERGEDDTAFEKQTALFAMASADVLLVNMWCHDIGREHGAGKPLLKTARARAFPDRSDTHTHDLHSRCHSCRSHVTASLRRAVPTRRCSR
jgi:hypothetical protein